MSALITDKLISPCGKLTNSTLGGYVDAAGNIVGSAQFLANFIVDYAGNIGALTPVVTDCTVTATIIGSALPPGDWEMQASTVETIGLNGGTISNSFLAGTTAPNLLSTFVSINATGYLDGVVSGTGTWTIRSGADTIGGTPYIGVGLLVATGANTHTGPIVMQTGSKLQLGADCSNTVTRSRGGLNIGEGAIATQYTSFPDLTYITQALNNDGTYNIIGCGTCGVGGVNLSNTVTNNGTINIEKAAWRNFSTWSGTGTVNVKDGGTFVLVAIPIGATTTVNINGCGWCNSAGKNIGALYVTGTGSSWNMKLNVKSPSCITTAVNANGTFSGVLTGNQPLTINGLGTTKPNGIVHFTNTANTYNGTMTVDGTNLSASYTTSLQYAKIVLVNGGRIGTNANSGQTIGSLASDDPTTYWSSGDPSNNIIKNNGITTFAGRLLWTGGQYAGNYFLDGGSQNQLTMTSTGNSGNIYPRNGSKLILQGATFTPGQVRVSGGSTVSAGTSTTAFANYLSIDAASGLDVRASGATTGKIGAGALGLVLSAGWKVNLLDPLPAGTHVIMTNAGAAVTQLPVIGTNLSGRTVTGFAWNNAVSPKTLSVTLA